MSACRGVSLRMNRIDLRRRFGSLVVDPSGSERLPGIQGVRAVSALSILLLHIWLLSPYKHGPLYHYVYANLPVGVTLLFILSSFLLYRPFAAAILRARPLPSIRTYLVNRALRILPAYWIVLF